MSERGAHSLKSQSEVQGDFGFALSRIKAGGRVRLAEWRETGEFVFLVAGSRFLVNRKPLLGIYEEGTEIEYCGHIDIRRADGKIMPWNPSHEEMLAATWEVVVDAPGPA